MAVAEEVEECMAAVDQIRLELMAAAAALLQNQWKMSSVEQKKICRRC